MKRTTPRDWVEKLRLKANVTCPEISCAEAAELADILEKLIVAAELQPTTNTEAHTNGRETT